MGSRATTQIESIKNHEEVETFIVNEVETDKKASNLYALTSLAAVKTHNSDEFFWNDNRDKIKRQISDVLETEWPISKTLLCKRILTAWNISRLGTRISSHFQILLKEMDLSPLKDGHREFYWQKEGTTEGYNLYRIPKNDLEKRDAEDLPPEEVANAVSEILSHQISLTRTDLIRETAKLFGYSRVGTNVEYAMGQGINKAIELGIVEEKDTRIVFTG